MEPPGRKATQVGQLGRREMQVQRDLRGPLELMAQPAQPGLLAQLAPKVL